MSTPISLLGCVPFETGLELALPSRALRVALTRTVTRLLGDVARQQGLTAHLSGDLEALKMLEARHERDGLELMPFLVAGVAPAAEALWLALVDNGQVVATTAAIYAYLPDGQTLRDRINDLTLFYAVPDVAREFGAAADCTAPVAAQVSGHVVILSGGWVDPAYRGRGLIEQAVRLCGLAAFARWSPDWVVGLIEHKISMRLVADSYGFPRRDSEVVLQVPRWPLLRFTVGAARRAEYERLCVRYQPTSAPVADMAASLARAWWSRPPLLASAAE